MNANLNIVKSVGLSECVCVLENKQIPGLLFSFEPQDENGEAGAPVYVAVPEMSLVALTELIAKAKTVPKDKRVSITLEKKTSL